MHLSQICNEIEELAHNGQLPQDLVDRANEAFTQVTAALAAFQQELA